MPEEMDVERSKMPKLEEVPFSQLVLQSWRLMRLGVRQWQKVILPWFLFCMVIGGAAQFLVLLGNDPIVHYVPMCLLQFITAGIAVSWVRHLHMGTSFTHPRDVYFGHWTFKFIFKQIFLWLAVSILASLLAIGVMGGILIILSSLQVELPNGDGTLVEIQYFLAQFSTEKGMNEADFTALSDYLTGYMNIAQAIGFVLAMFFLVRYGIVMIAAALGIEMKVDIAHAATKTSFAKMGGVLIVASLPMALLLGGVYVLLQWLPTLETGMMEVVGIFILSFLQTLFSFVSLLVLVAIYVVFWQHLLSKFKIHIVKLGDKTPPPSDKSSGE